MFKKVPGNSEYLINLNRELINSYGEIAVLTGRNKDSISLEMFGKQKTIATTWLSLSAWYEIGCIPNLEEHFKKIKFCQCLDKTLSINCKSVMFFTDPIYYRDGFRIIPCFPRYAINLDSDVLDISTNKIVTKRELTPDGYEVAYIYSPDKNGFRYTRIHRLLALAWLPNNDFENRPFVNHIDGNRANNRLENLEWCSASENSKHALDTGLNKCPVKMKSRDSFTGEVVIYQSVSEMSRKLGTTSVNGSAYLNKLPGYRFKGRYEIKLFEDDSPWYFENDAIDHDDHGKAIYTITVLDKKTGESQKFSNVRSFYKKFELWTKSGTLEDGIALFKSKYQDHDISYRKNSINGPYKVINLETKQTVLLSSMLEVSNYTNISKTEIQFDLSRGLKFVYLKKWVIAVGMGEINLTDYSEKKKSFSKVAIVDSTTGLERIADSIKHAARITGIDPKTIARKLNTSELIKGLNFRALEQ